MELKSISSAELERPNAYSSELAGYGKAGVVPNTQQSLYISILALPLVDLAF